MAKFKFKILLAEDDTNLGSLLKTYLEAKGYSTVLCVNGIDAYNKYVKEKFNSDFVFVTHYPTTKRPVYTYPDETDPEYTKSFDMLFRGVEVTTGGQRINDYNQLLKNIAKWRNKLVVHLVSSHIILYE